MLKKTILSNPLTMERLGLVRQVSAVDMPAAVVAGDNHGVAAGNIGTVNFKSSKGSTKIAHPVGSIGADIPKKGYLEYLVRKYFEARGKGIRYGDKHLEKMKLECGKIQSLHRMVNFCLSTLGTLPDHCGESGKMRGRNGPGSVPFSL